MQYLIDQNDLNKRLDVYVAALNLGLTRSHAHKLIDDKSILVNDKPAKANYKLKKDDKLTIDIPEPKELKVEPENIPLNILYEDRDIIVINKKRGMVVHPAVGNYAHTLVNALLFHCKDLSGIGGVMRPGIVHRLDKDTTGAMVIAKNDAAHQALSKQFKEHTVKKIYLALVRGTVKNNRGIISDRIGRHPFNRQKMAVIEIMDEGREARTDYAVVKRLEGKTLLRIKLGTGRTHQIRVHLSHIGYPVLGDPVYGGGKGGQLLHAETLGFIHPTTHEYVEFEAPLPFEMEKELEKDE